MCWRREPGGGNTDPPERDNLRVSAETAEREKLNDERGVKPLPVNDSRDGAESVKLNLGVYGGASVFFPQKSFRARGMETVPERELRTCRMSQDVIVQPT